MDWRPEDGGPYRVFARILHNQGRTASLTPEHSLHFTFDPCGGGVVCEDFEAAVLGQAPDAPWRSTGDVFVTDESAYSGAHALRAEGAGGGYDRNFITLDIGALEGLPQTLFGRVMVRVEPSDAAGNSFAFLSAEGGPKPGSGAPNDTAVMYRLRISDEPHPTDPDIHLLMANYETWADGDGDGRSDWPTDCWRHSNAQLKEGEWACVEWAFDAERDALSFWIDGWPVADLGVEGEHPVCGNLDTQGGQWTAPARFERLNLGLEGYHGYDEPRAIFLDDIAIGDRRVGCAPPQSSEWEASGVAE